MIKIGITGQSGFVGTHLYNILGQSPEKYIRIPFEDRFFYEFDELCKFVRECDVIVHLAALVRSPNVGEVYSVNMNLAHQLINAIEDENKEPSLLFASSIQEGDGTEYGTYKKEVRCLFESWTKAHNSGFGCMVFPNLFGPLARPNSHSFVATFCYRLTHGEEPVVLTDKLISLKYIKSLLDELLPMIDDVAENKASYTKAFEPDYKLMVTEVLSTLTQFRDLYLSNGVIPEFRTKAEKDLFDTFVSYKDYVL